MNYVIDQSTTKPEFESPPSSTGSVLTIGEVAVILRCSKAHVSNLLNGKVAGAPLLTHVKLGRRKLIRREWLEQWMEDYKSQ